MSSDMIDTAEVAQASRRRRALGVAGQVAGAIGVGVSVILIVLLLLARGWVVETANDLATDVNMTIARADPLLEIADRAILGVGERMNDLATAAEQVATTDRPTPEALVPLQERLSTLTERYLVLREGYASLRAEVASAADRARTIAQLLPFIDVPTGPRDALAAVDQRLQALDDRIMSVVEAGGLGGAVDQRAAAIAERARNAEASLADATAAIDAIEARLVELQAKVTGVARTVDNSSTIVTLVMILLLVYLAFLHVVLFRVGRQYREPAAA